MTAVVLAAPACADRPPAVERAPPIAVDSAGVEIVTSDPLNSDARCTLSEEPAVSIGSLEGDDPYLFYFLRGANRLSDGSIAVMDNGTGEIRIFSAQGEHLRSMGGKGEGPGEFRIGRFIWVLPGDTLWVGDYRPWRYHVYAADGQYSRTVDIKPLYFNASLDGGVLDNGTSINVRDLFDWMDERFQRPEPLYVEAHAADGTLIGELAELNGMRWGNVEGSDASVFVLFDPVPRIAARGATIAIATAREPEVRILDEQFRLRRIVRWEDREGEVTGAHVQRWREAYMERRGGRRSEDWSGVDEAVVSEDRPVAEVFPAVADVAVGRDGRLWVLPYRKPGGTVERMAFGPDGRFLCHFANTSGAAIYEFGADYILGVDRDEMDVERVVMYELRVPGDVD